MDTAAALQRDCTALRLVAVNTSAVTGVLLQRGTARGAAAAAVAMPCCIAMVAAEAAVALPRCTPMLVALAAAVAAAAAATTAAAVAPHHCSGALVAIGIIATVALQCCSSLVAAVPGPLRSPARLPAAALLLSSAALLVAALGTAAAADAL